MNQKANRELTQPQKPFPRIDQLFIQSARIWNERPDLQEAFPDPKGVEYWLWLMWFGYDTYNEVREALYPVPDRFLVDRVVGEFVPEKNYHTSGIVDARRMIQCLQENGFSFSDQATILDFGCGCARLMRFFACFAYQCRFFGADVDADAVQWCEKCIDFAEFRKVGEKPPAPYSESFFDAIYSYSVFSHFSEELHLTWLEELHRIAKPGALLVLTVQGKKMIELDQVNCQATDNLQNGENRFIFFPYQHLQFYNKQNEDFYSNWNLQNYGDAFIFRPYIEKAWSGFFELIDLLEGPDDSQDYVVLRNKG